MSSSWHKSQHERHHMNWSTYLAGGLLCHAGEIILWCCSLLFLWLLSQGCQPGESGESRHWPLVKATPIGLKVLFDTSGGLDSSGSASACIYNFCRFWCQGRYPSWQSTRTSPGSAKSGNGEWANLPCEIGILGGVLSSDHHQQMVKIQMRYIWIGCTFSIIRLYSAGWRTWLSVKAIDTSK